MGAISEISSIISLYLSFSIFFSSYHAVLLRFLTLLGHFIGDSDESPQKKKTIKINHLPVSPWSHSAVARDKLDGNAFSAVLHDLPF